MEPAVDEQALLAGADFIFRSCRPGEAEPLARRLASAFAALDPKPVYVDCNAVSPQTRNPHRRDAGADFVDGGIIGGPPDRAQPYDLPSGPTAKPRYCATGACDWR